MAVATAVGHLMAFALISISPAGRVAEVGSIRLGEGIALGTAWMTFAVVGAIIVRHQPGNAVGWLCCIAGLVDATVALSVGIATWTLTADPPLPIGVAAAWFSHVGSVLIVLAPLLILFRFPTGRPLGRWWRRAEVLTAAVVGTFALVFAIEPMRLLGYPGTPNPLAVGDAPRMTAVGFAPVIVCAALAVASLVVRFRHGSPTERRQLRVLAAASVVVVVVLATMTLTSPDLIRNGQLSTQTAIANAIGFAAIPIAIGVAIVRNGLYDIDRLVNRTAVYAIVSAVLVGIYAVAVIGLSGLLASVAPKVGASLATAGSTLLVAVLFRPVRERAQRTVDRRFDRERYEATLIVASFASQVRGETELDAIIDDLWFAASQTVRPSTASCWIRRRAAH